MAGGESAVVSIGAAHGVGAVPSAGFASGTKASASELSGFALPALGAEHVAHALH
jgi:hypothetical protein